LNFLPVAIGSFGRLDVSSLFIFGGSDQGSTAVADFAGE
jgi:hypothetical protein